VVVAGERNTMFLEVIEYFILSFCGHICSVLGRFLLRLSLCLRCLFSKFRCKCKHKLSMEAYSSYQKTRFIFFYEEMLAPHEKKC
jgi:hypothetical protein